MPCDGSRITANSHTVGEEAMCLCTQSILSSLSHMRLSVYMCPLENGRVYLTGSLKLKTSTFVLFQTVRYLGPVDTFQKRAFVCQTCSLFNSTSFFRPYAHSRTHQVLAVNFFPCSNPQGPPLPLPLPPNHNTILISSWPWPTKFQ